MLLFDTASETNVINRHDLLTQSWKVGPRQAGRDIRKRGPRCCIYFSVLLWVLGLCVALLFLGLSSGGAFDIGKSDACLPDGSFGLDPSSYNYWSNSGFFEITLGFGSLTFTEAKILDVAWDVFVGRGGQAILAVISWRIFARYITTSMEFAPVTFRTYRTIFVQNQSMILAIPCLIRDFVSRRALRSKAAMCFIILTMTFILVFPTFAGAMTGYTGNLKAYINATDGNYVPFSAFGLATFVIQDGSRIDLTDNYMIPYYVGYGSDPTLDRMAWSQFGRCFFPLDESELCYMTANLTDYVTRFGFLGAQHVSSEFMAVKLDPPTLNISAWYLPDPLSRRADPGTSDYLETLQVYNDPSRWRWMYNNEIYNSNEIKQHGKCQPLTDYQWGFSFLQLFIMLINLLLWTVGMSMIWLKSHILMKRRGRSHVAGENRAVLELAHAMHENFIQLKDTHDLNKANLSESNLRRRINNDLLGGSISYESTQITDQESRIVDTSWGFKLWIKTDKWWLLVISFTTVLSLTLMIVYERRLWFFMSVPFELAVAYHIGTTNQSRTILFLGFFIPSSIAISLVWCVWFVIPLAPNLAT